MRSCLRTVLCTVSLSLAACAPGALDAQSRPGVQRQAMTEAFTATPDFTANLVDRWGTALAPCGNGYVVAGEARGSVRQWPAPVGPTTEKLNDFARAVGCDVSPGSPLPRTLVGGDAGLFFLGADAGWQPMLSDRVGSFALPPIDTGLPMVIGQPNGRVFAFNALTVDAGTTIVDLSPDAVTPALAWHPQKPLLAVGQPGTREVTVWRYDASGFTLALHVLVGSTPGFGRALAWGNLAPQPGLELVVASEGQADVYALGLDPLDPLFTLYPDGDSATFGVSVTTQQGSGYGDLDFAWVGDPGTSTAYRFIGKEKVAFTGPTGGAQFGQALTSWAPGTVSVGAPATNGGKGAVYTRREDGGVVPGAPASCSSSSTCFSRACAPGTCLGDVFCQPTGDPGTPCPGGAVCNVDGLCGAYLEDGGFAPTPEEDAGVDAGVDAGASSDAGSGEDGGTAADAGTGADGGVGGPVIFHACGCSGGPLAPVLLLALALLRRAR